MVWRWTGRELCRKVCSFCWPVARIVSNAVACPRPRENLRQIRSSGKPSTGRLSFPSHRSEARLLRRPLGGPLRLPRRRPCRDRQQRRREHDPPPQPAAEERTLRRPRRGRTRLGADRLAHRDLQAEQGRPARLPHRHPRGDRRRPPREPDRRPHAVSLLASVKLIGQGPPVAAYVGSDAPVADGCEDALICGPVRSGPCARRGRPLRPAMPRDPW